ncbi:MAG: PQQ-like beta-propeller repeat protein [Candidatus Hydrogenedentes bacterium]|nr:PQQ-like beta-propeller repeat protein [Candidatus Hydrogenedentota bacterium]
MRALLLATTLWLAISSVTIACAADWPQFRGPNRDAKSTETGLLKKWPEQGLTPLWTVDGLGNGYSSVSVANGMIFTTGMVGDKNEGIISAIDLAGKIKWQTNYGPDWSEMHPGSRSTPTVDGNRLYELTGVGRLICLDANTGEILWSQDLPKEFSGEAPMCGFAEAPLIYKDMVICTPGGKDAALAGLDRITGKTVWTSSGFSDQSAYCSPILIERGGIRLVVTITARNVAGLDADTGKLIWAHPFDTDAKDPNHSVAPVYDDGRLYVTSGHRDGGQMLEISPDGRTVAPRWSDKVLNTLHGGLVLVDGYVYGSNSKDKWVCLDLKTGQVMYQTRGVGMGSVAYADGMLYCYGEKGTLGLVRATSQSYDLISSFKVTQGDGPYWAHPVISGGRLYIRHGDFLMAYEVAAR